MVASVRLLKEERTRNHKGARILCLQQHAQVERSRARTERTWREAPARAALSSFVSKLTMSCVKPHCPSAPPTLQTSSRTRVSPQEVPPPQNASPKARNPSCRTIGADLCETKAADTCNHIAEENRMMTKRPEAHQDHNVYEYEPQTHRSARCG